MWCFFFVIGKIPNGKPFANLVATDEGDRNRESCEAGTPGVFAGDGRSKDVKQLTTAEAAHENEPRLADA